MQTHLNKKIIELFIYNDYNNNYQIIKKELILSQEIIEKVKKNYNLQNENKKNKSIELLYDKDRNKTNKLSLRASKNYSTIVFLNNRRNYYKDI